MGIEEKAAVRSVTSAVSVSLFSPGSTFTSCPGHFSIFVVFNGNLELTLREHILPLKNANAVLVSDSEILTASGAGEIVRIAFAEDVFFRFLLPVIEGNPILTSFFVHTCDHSPVSYFFFRGLSKALLARVQSMLEEYEYAREGFESVLVCDFLSLLLQMSRSCWVDASVTEIPNSQILQQMLDYLVRNFRSVTLGELAEHFNYHPNSVSAILKKGTGKTFSSLVLQARMNHAASMLARPGVSVRTVAEECGYGNMSNFYARFEEYYGVTPGVYAQTVQKQTGKAAAE